LGGPGAPTPDLDGQAIAVAYDPTGRLLVQTREPLLVVGDRAVVLTGSVIEDTGHELFHMATAGGLACASCHPEGREDGHVWSFDTLGQRRTQSIGGGLAGTEPFHWGGDMKDFAMLTHEVMTGRMSGPALRGGHVDALAKWIDAVPPWKSAAAVDPSAVVRGRDLFASDAVGCASCHAGAKLTNNQTVDVGTGAPFQVPSLLGLSYRAPFLHQGCAMTLDDRFNGCGGGDKHGKTSALTTTQRADLVAYLGSL
jgi:cytochrome c